MSDWLLLPMRLALLGPIFLVIYPMALVLGVDHAEHYPRWTWQAIRYGMRAAEKMP